MHTWAETKAIGAAGCAAALLGLASGFATAQPSTPTTSAAQRFQQAVTLIETRGDCQAALPLLEPIARGQDRALAARALVYTGGCHERLGATRARQAYRQVIDQYPDQRAAVAEARTRLQALDRRATTRASSTTLRKLLSGEDHDGNVGQRAVFADLLKHVEAGHVGKAQVEQHEVRLTLGEGVETGLSIGGFTHFVPLVLQRQTQLDYVPCRTMSSCG